MNEEDRKQKSHQENYPIVGEVNLQSAKQAFKERYSEDIYFGKMKDREQALEIGVTRKTIGKWKQQLAEEGFFKDIHEKRMRIIVEKMPMVIEAVAEKAMRSGDSRAAQFLVEYVLGWASKSAMDLNVGKQFDGKTNDQLMEEAVGGMPEEKRMSLLARFGDKINNKPRVVDIEKEEKGTWPPAVGE